MTNFKQKALIQIPFLISLLWLIPTALVQAQGFANIKWNSPLQFNRVEDLVIAILNAIITIAVPIIVLMIIYGGFQYVTARGNAEQIKTATRTLTYAIIGGILIIGAIAITTIMDQAVSNFTAP